VLLADAADHVEHAAILRAESKVPVKRALAFLPAASRFGAGPAEEGG
jgi:hypothetical protein